MGRGMVVAVLATVVVLAAGGGVAEAKAGAAGSSGASASGQKMLRAVVMGLPPRGNAIKAAARIAYPGGGMYRKFVTQGGLREQFGARPAVRRKVLSLRKQRGVRRVSLNPSQTFALAVMRPAAAKRLFCAGPRIPGRPCRPRGFRWAISGVSVGEIFPQGPAPTPPKSAAGASGTPEGCSGAIASKALTPNQLNTAYEVDGLRSRGLDGSGVAVNTLSSAVVGLGDFRTWAACFDQPAPQVTQFAMPGGVVETQDDPDETVLDVEALSAIAPRLERITPVFVPLDQNFSNSFLLFMLGSLDPSRQGGGLPDVLSISDGVCEYRFRRAEKFLANRLLAEASALGITALSASGDLGFRGCESGRQGTSFPASSRFVTGVGGTNLDLAGDNHILGQPVWSTYATEPREGVGSGGGPSAFWSRPGFQAGPGITPALEKGDPTRLVPDVAAMASFEPGIAVFQESSQGWGGGGGTSAATPLTAAMVALAIQQEREAGRPALGSINPLLYSLARGSAYATNFFDVTVGTSSQKPDSPRGMSPAGGAAQPGYDLATGLGSLRAAAFADAVAATPPAP